MRVASALFVVLCVACDPFGGGDDSGAPPGVVDCGDLDEDLLARLNFESQLVLNLSLAEGGNYSTMVETTGLPDPETFRDFAEVFEALDLRGIDPLVFDAPAQVVADLRTTADVLEAALAVGDMEGAPAWVALGEFYTDAFFVTHNSSIAHYVSEAGCSG